MQRAAELNCPLITVPSQSHAGELKKSESFASVDKKNVVIDTVKKTEDGNNIIVRIYEAYGQRGNVALTFGYNPTSVLECNLMEEADQALDVNGNSISIHIKPYEIRTFKVKFG